MEDRIMAGYNRGIVATRKLNDNNKARLGRGGDTEIREVDGKKSHVNALEAYLIDVEGRAGEEYTKKVGSGTINPLTGMPEYQNPQRLSYEELQELQASDPSGYEAYLEDWGIFGTYHVSEGTNIWGTGGDIIETVGGVRQFIENPWEQGAEEMGFISRGEELAKTQATNVLGATERGAAFSEKTLGSQLGFQQRGLQESRTAAGEAATQQRGTLGRGYRSGSSQLGRSITQARTGMESAAGRSGLVSSSVTGAFEKQKAGLMKDYAGMTKEYQAGLGDVGTMQRQAGRAYDLGMEKTQSAYDLGMEGVGLDLETARAGYETSISQAALTAEEATYRLQKQQMDKFYGQLFELGDVNVTTQY